MAVEWKGKVALDIRDAEPDWAPFLAPQAPKGSPNVLVICWDDVGYGTMESFGGPVRTPAMTRIAERGVKLANFHTTALCSPTRASLLTGRNATSNGMATIAEFSSGFPGISTRIPFENGLISEVLVEQGYNTYCVGKWHLTPGEETGMSAWKRRWPLGRGFERFYGFLGGEASSWFPDLVHDNHPVEPPSTPAEGYHIAWDLTDRSIEFIKDSTTIDPDKPWFLYFSLDAAHAPHHVWPEWADRYKGVFDEGYEAIREGILARQVELGLLPEGTELSPINPHGEPMRTGPDGQPWPLLDTVRPWATLSDDEKRLFVRMAEVFAGYVEYTDSQVGRLLDFLEESGQLDNTIVVVVSDNGASGEGGPNGTYNEWQFFNGVATPTELSLQHIDELGGPETHNHYNTGWAWAFDTPFPYWKRWAGYEGGIADMCIVSWPARIPADSVPRQQYVHAVDVVPTIYDLIGLEPPAEVAGYTQSPLEGESFAAALTDPAAPAKSTQFYAMLGQRSVYEDGWLACTLHPPLSGWGKFEEDEWELYHVAEDRAQARNVAAEHPEKVQELVARWFELADQYHGLPLDDRNALEQTLSPRPSGAPPRDRYVFYPDTAPVPELSGPRLPGRSYTVSAGVTLESADAEGVLYAHGGVSGGHSLYVQGGRLAYAYNWLDIETTTVVADRAITPGAHVFTAEFSAEGKSAPPRPGAAGTLRLYVDGEEVGTSPLVTQPGFFNATGDGHCVGRDDGSPVTRAYVAPFRFTGGTIDRVVIDLSGTPYRDHEAEVRGWFMLD
ncbi:sulfatase-like hydrolase/transferase [Longivirga aurantiaca]|uniref:Sulfatase-like hydrolase/transferase n=1 Tax=Longivirga aurantiaca TaxID=1837743 RepID=A0ABW1T446_9ACTN